MSFVCTAKDAVINMAAGVYQSHFSPVCVRAWVATHPWLALAMFTSGWHVCFYQQRSQTGRESSRLFPRYNRVEINSRELSTCSARGHSNHHYRGHHPTSLVLSLFVSFTFCYLFACMCARTHTIPAYT